MEAVIMANSQTLYTELLTSGILSLLKYVFI